MLLQTLAIYDRFGRLMLGDEQQPKDVLEYLVIERHLVNPYSRWRLHGKIVPSWAPAKDPIIKVSGSQLVESRDTQLFPYHELVTQVYSTKIKTLAYFLSCLAN